MRAVVSVVVLVVLVVGIMLSGLVMGVGALVFGADPCAGRQPLSVSAASVEGVALKGHQVAHAATVIEAGREMGVPEYAVVIALATAMQESSFEMVANSGSHQLEPDQVGVEASLEYPHDRVADDHGSVGLFAQQWPWWGTMDELMDARQSSRIFYEALLKVEGWESMAVAVAAQTVQRSDFPDAYARHEGLARRLLAGHGGALPPGDVECGRGAAMTCAAVTPIDVGLTPDALRVARCVTTTFGPHTMYGVSQRPNNPLSDHPTGRAVDVMIDEWASAAGIAHGDEIALWLQQNHDRLGVRYLIWRGRIWHTKKLEEGWRAYSHPSGQSNPTLDHMDHIHVSVHGNAAGAAMPGGVPASGDWAHPLGNADYRVSSEFGPRVSPGGIGSSYHRGIDLAAPQGTNVYAACTGTVTAAGRRGGYGNYVGIRCSGGAETGYAHLHMIALDARVGEPVTAGTRIGSVGSTGNSTGDHLHYEVRTEGTLIDPRPFMATVGVRF